MALNEEQSEYLRSLYYDITKTGSLRGVRTFYQLIQREGKHPEIRQKDVKEWFKSQTTYTLWKPVRKNYPRNSIRAQYVGHIFQFDLMNFNLKHQKEIDKKTKRVFTYALVGVDTFSRFAFVVALTGRTSKIVTEALAEIFEENDYKPTSAFADSAGEHVSNVTKVFFKKRGIHLYYATSLIHAPAAERMIKTLRMGLRRYQASQNSLKWVRPLKQLVRAYNDTVTRTHHLKPKDVFLNLDFARWKAYENLYFKPKQKMKIKKIKKKPSLRKKVPKNLPRIGEYVRISRLKKPFEKESTYLGQFSREIFKIVARNTTTVNPMFKLVDLKGVEIKGKFYLPEIQVIANYNPEDRCLVEDVLETRGGKVKVKWVGYKKSDATWIYKSDLENLRENQSVSRLN